MATALLAASVALAACTTTLNKPPEPAPATTSLQEYMLQGSKAHTEGAREKARETYQSAARAYPSSKEPWLKLSEDFFEAADYGNAILAGQEVLLRDPGDNVAASVLAVSGLRISTSALQTLRTQNRIAGDTRSEAQTMAQTLRDVLGESVLVPIPPPVALTQSAAVAPPAYTPPSPAPVRRPIRVRPPTPAPVAAPAPTPVATVRPVDPAPPPPTGNPFDKLK